MFADPMFAENQVTAEQKAQGESHTYYGSPAFLELNDVCNGRLTNPSFKSSLWILGADGVQLLNFGARTACIIGLKCEDLHPAVAHTKIAYRPLLVLEGCGGEPKALHEVLRPTVNFFRECAPCGTSPFGELCG